MKRTLPEGIDDDFLHRYDRAKRVLDEIGTCPEHGSEVDFILRSVTYPPDNAPGVEVDIESCCDAHIDRYLELMMRPNG